MFPKTFKKEGRRGRRQRSLRPEARNGAGSSGPRAQGIRLRRRPHPPLLQPLGPHTWASRAPPGVREVQRARPLPTSGNTPSLAPASASPALSHQQLPAKVPLLLRKTGPVRMNFMPPRTPLQGPSSVPQHQIWGGGRPGSGGDGPRAFPAGLLSPGGTRREAEALALKQLDPRAHGVL